MHRHGYKGRKFGREKDERNALIKSLANSLVLEESIETTLPKAKEVLPYVEKLITKAKKGDLHNRRQVIASLMTLEAAHKLVDEIAPKLKGRTSGHLRIERTRLRRGDNAQLASISFVDDLSVPSETKAVKAEASDVKTVAAGKSEAKVAEKTEAKTKPAAKKTTEPKSEKKEKK